MAETRKTRPVSWIKAVWAIHAFQKKSEQGIKTPKRELDMVKERLKKLKEVLR